MQNLTIKTLLNLYKTIQNYVVGGEEETFKINLYECTKIHLTFNGTMHTQTYMFQADFEIIF